MIRAAAASLFALALPLSFPTWASAKTITTGGLSMPMPAGWSSSEGKNGTIILSKPKRGKVLVSPPRKAKTSSPSKEFDKILRSLGGKKAAKWKRYDAVTRQGYRVKLAGEFIKRRGKRAYVLPVALFTGTDIALVTLIDPGYRGRNKAKKEFGQMLAGLKIKGAKSRALGPANKRNTIDGFFVRIGGKAVVSATANVQTIVGVRGRLFKSDGRFALSETAVAQDFDSYCRKRVRNCGQYRIINGKLHTWRSGSRFMQSLGLAQTKTATISFKRNGNMVLGVKEHRKILPYGKPTLSGRFRLVSAGANIDAGGARRSAYIEGVYDFANDGKFAYGGNLARSDVDSNVSIVVRGKRRVRPGRYQIDGYSMKLRFKDGKKKNLAFFMFDDVPVINGRMYQRLDK